uniref:dTDP-4-dehydrorhamnose reductase n=1 Tax=Orrella sp. TaxID=1921583 RepID=UPI004048A6AF
MSELIPKRVLVTGGQGQVGHALVQQLAPDFQPIGYDRLGLDLSDLDRLADKLHAAIEVHQPCAIINAAAFTAVDRAESQESLAYDVNALAPGIMATVATSHGLPLVHYSTDYVFDGQHDGAYTENDLTGPLSVYGRSKLAGEKAVMAANGPHLILRTSWVFGAHGQNFLKTMLRLAQERDALSVVNDQIGAPTSAELIAQSTHTALSNLIGGASAHDPRWGLYNLAASGHTSWHGYAQYLISHARTLGWPIRIRDDAIEGIAARDYPVAAVRPMNSRLDTTKWQQSFGETLPDWRVGVDHALANIPLQP